MLAQQTLQVWQGQYPPPEAVEHYERILPGSFDRMIGMAERLQAAQIDESRRALDYTQADARRGHWLGAAIAVLAMMGALICLRLDFPFVAAIFVGIPVMAVAKALIETATSQRSQSPPTQQPKRSSAKATSTGAPPENPDSQQI